MLLVLSVTFISASCVKDGDEDKVRNYVVPGDELPSFVTANGPYGALSDTDFAGKRGMLVFFTSYCPDCHQLMPSVKEVWDELGGEPGYMIASVSRVSGYETEANLAKWWDEKGYDPMPYYTDVGQIVFNKFGNHTIPRVYIINDGKVTWMSVGISNLSADFLIDKIKSQS